MIQAESNSQKRDEYLLRLMVLPNQKLQEIIGPAGQNVDFLKDQDVIQTLLNTLQTNTRVAYSLGKYFLPQITLIFSDMLNVYRMYSELISKSIVEGGPFASRTVYVKILCSVKREILKLIETFLDKAEAQPQIGKQFVLPMIEYIPQIFEVVFMCTINMITKNFEDYPEHRLNIFSLLHAIATHCFPALISLSSRKLMFVISGGARQKYLGWPPSK